MSQKILIDSPEKGQTQFALLSDNGLEDFEFESTTKKNLKGNIYLGKVSRIEASLQAAFVDIGSEKNGFLAFGEIHPNYFQIPVADREALIQAEAEIEEEHLNDEELNDNNENSDFKDEMKSALSYIQSGDFHKQWKEEASSGYPELSKMRKSQTDSPLNEITQKMLEILKSSRDES